MCVFVSPTRFLIKEVDEVGSCSFAHKIAFYILHHQYFEIYYTTNFLLWKPNEKVETEKVSNQLLLTKKTEWKKWDVYLKIVIWSKYCSKAWHNICILLCWGLHFKCIFHANYSPSYNQGMHQLYSCWVGKNVCW